MTRVDLNMVIQARVKRETHETTKYMIFSENRTEIFLRKLYIIYIRNINEPRETVRILELSDNHGSALTILIFSSFAAFSRSAKISLREIHFIFQSEKMNLHGKSYTFLEV